LIEMWHGDMPTSLSSHNSVGHAALGRGTSVGSRISLRQKSFLIISNDSLVQQFLI
jgi:hypothetical protein